MILELLLFISSSRVRFNLTYKIQIIRWWRQRNKMTTSVLHVHHLNSALQYPFMLPQFFISFSLLVFLLLTYLPLTICIMIATHLKTPVNWSNVSVCFILLKSFYTLLADQQSHIRTVTCFSVAKGNTTDGKNCGYSTSHATHTNT